MLCHPISCVMLWICMFSGLSIGIGYPIGVLPPGEDISSPLGFPQLPVVPCAELRLHGFSNVRFHLLSFKPHSLKSTVQAVCSLSFN